LPNQKSRITKNLVSHDPLIKKEKNMLFEWSRNWKI